MNETLLVYNLTEMDDAERCATLRALHPAWKVRGGYGSQAPWELVPHGPSPDGAVCLLARLYVRPQCPWEPKDIFEDEFAQGVSHLSRCPSCQAWYQSGMPFHFVMAWEKHREMLCHIMREGLEHEDEWPLSFTAALDHARECATCAKWHSDITRSCSCEAVRDRYEDGTRDVTWSWDEPEQGLMSSHFAGCEACLQWALSLPCETVRREIRRVIIYNANEWKSYRHIELCPPQEIHAARCAACHEWQAAFEREYHAQQRELWASWSQEGETISTKEARPEAAPVSAEAESGVASQAGGRQASLSKRYATREEAIQATLHFLREQSEPPQGERDSTELSPAPLWTAEQSDLGLPRLFRDDDELEKQLKPFPSPQELLNETPDLGNLLHLFERSDEDDGLRSGLQPSF